jgi:hypothetical protein
MTKEKSMENGNKKEKYETAGCVKNLFIFYWIFSFPDSGRNF